MNKLYLSSGFNHEPISVVIAQNLDFAEIAFMAMDNGHAHTEEIDLESDVVKNNKVSFILNSQVVPVSDLPSNRTREFRKWRRGR